MKHQPSTLVRHAASAANAPRNRSTRTARRRASTLLVVAASFGAGCAVAPPEAPTCPSDAAVAAQVQAFVALQSLADATPGLTLEGAACGARKLVAGLTKTQGKVVGYKAGLTTTAVQQRFGVHAPLRGALLEKMLLKDGAEVPARFGVRPFAEPDLMVEVGSSAIHDAKTPLEVLAHLSAIVPFIELPDLLVTDPGKITGPAILANNVGARLGVLGAPLPVQRTPAFAEALQRMTVKAHDATGKELSSAPGAAILGHPLNAVIWLAAELAREGITLKPGDLLSLGAFGNLPVAAGQTLRVSYEGLPGQPTVHVRFK